MKALKIILFAAGALALALYSHHVCTEEEEPTTSVIEPFVMVTYAAPKEKCYQGKVYGYVTPYNQVAYIEYTSSRFHEKNKSGGSSIE